MKRIHACLAVTLAVCALTGASVAQGQPGKKKARPATKGRSAAATVKAANSPADRPIALFGEVIKPGLIDYRSGMTVKQTIEAAGGFTEQADTANVMFRRPGAAVLGTLNGKKALEGDAIQNVALRPGDTLYVPRLKEPPVEEKGADMPVGTKPVQTSSQIPQPPAAETPAPPSASPNTAESAPSTETAPQRPDSGRFAVVGAVARPGTFAYQENLMLKEVIQAVGGLTKEADQGKIVILRGMLNDPSTAQPIEYDYSKALKGEKPDIALQPGDVVQVPARGKKRGIFDRIGDGLKRILPPKKVQEQIGDVVGRLVSTATLARALPVVGSLLGHGGEKEVPALGTAGTMTRAAGALDGQPTVLEIALLQALQAESPEVQQRILRRVEERLQANP